MEARQEFYEVLKKQILDRGLAKHVSLYNQNLDYIAEDETLPIPAVLIHIGAFEWRVLTGDLLTGDAEVKLHVVTEWNTEGDDAMGWNLSQDIMKLMSQLKNQSAGDNFAIMRPIGSATNADHGNLLETIDAYSVRFYSQFRP